MLLLTETLSLQKNLLQSLLAQVQQKQTEEIQALVHHKDLLEKDLSLEPLDVELHLELLPLEGNLHEDLLHHVVLKVLLQQRNLAPDLLSFLEVVLVEQTEAALGLLAGHRRLAGILNETISHYKKI